MAAEAQKTKGQQYMAEADKALKKFSFFNSGQKFEDAVEAYTKAGNCFKVAKAWQEGGEAFSKAAELHVKLNSTYDAANSIQEAAGCYKNFDSEAAVAAMRQAVGYLSELGKFKQVGKLHKDIAEIYEKEGEYDQAVENFTQAADYFNSDGNKSSANECTQKVATLLTSTRGDAEPSVENYSRAAKILEDMGLAALENRLLQYNAKNHFMNALLCFFAMGDQVAAEAKIGQYKTSDYTFGESRECKFMEKLLKAWTEGDPDAFTDHCSEYNQISPLDPWRTSLLVRCKRSISAAAAGAEDVDIM